MQIYKLAMDDQFKKKHKVFDDKGGYCPRCNQDNHMVRLIREHRDFRIDVCPACHGHWLEAGELTELRKEHRYKELLKKVHGN